MKFLIQRSPDRKVFHDFAFELMQAQQYYEWLGKEELEIRWTANISFKHIDNPDEYIPVGSVEFISAYMRKFYQKAAEKALKPLNVPEAFYPNAKRSIGTFNMSDSNNNASNFFGNIKKVYCKSTSRIKDENNGLYYIDSLPKEGEWQISEYLDIISEWRVFVFNGNIEYIGNYSGDCMVFPNADEITEMVRMWHTIYPNECPKAYTLDVAVARERGTIVMECHRFFSCGLYGFSDHARIPKMLSQEWHEMKRMI